jgi:hypothetical protein
MKRRQIRADKAALLPQIVEKTLNSRNSLLTRAPVSCKKSGSFEAHSGSHACFYEIPRGLVLGRIGEKNNHNTVSSESLTQRHAARSLKKIDSFTYGRRSND